MLKEKLVMESKNFSKSKMLTGNSVSVRDINTVFTKYLTLVLIHFLCVTPGLLVFFNFYLCLGNSKNKSRAPSAQGK